MKILTRRLKDPPSRDLSKCEKENLKLPRPLNASEGRVNYQEKNTLKAALKRRNRNREGARGGKNLKPVTGGSGGERGKEAGRSGNGKERGPKGS